MCTFGCPPLHWDIRNRSGTTDLKLLSVLSNRVRRSSTSRVGRGMPEMRRSRLAQTDRAAWDGDSVLLLYASSVTSYKMSHARYLECAGNCAGYNKSYCTL